MLQKQARPGYKKFIKTSAKTLIVVEAILFAVSYAGWYRLNTNRGGWDLGLLFVSIVVKCLISLSLPPGVTEFRYYVKENYPSILEAYYQLGETLGGDKSIRVYDENIWQQEQQQQQQVKK
uniref:Uncharacterized protein n=1 Tax=Anopheles maculatus TaxID=74869 RepID=A0A182SW54_9DIPT